jgi:putative aldouronate transport system permease protein
VSSLAKAEKRLAKSAKPGKTLGRRIAENWQLYLMLVIPIVITVIYKYIPMYGIQIAFRDYKAARGFFGSEWVGFKWFEQFFTAPNFGRMIKNTVLLSLFSLLWSFPVPIILALAINQLRFKKYKRVVQTVLYAPHFISIMVVCGMIRIFLSPYGGLVNLLTGNQIDYMTLPGAFRTIYIASGIWQDAGWGTIIYLATLSAVDPGLYEAAKIDGASMFQRIRVIDIPELIPMVILQLIMAVSGIMSVGFEKVFLLQTQLNKATSDVIAVYVYEQGIVKHAYSYSTAIGLFNTVINIILLVIVNKIAKKAADVSFV